MTKQLDPLSVLGLFPPCTLEEVKERFRSLAKKFHPDKNKAPGAQAHFTDLLSAVDMLEHDTTLLNRSTSLKTRSKGKDLHISITVKSEDLYFGERISVVSSRYMHCVACHGTGASDSMLHHCRLCEGTGSIPGGLMRMGTGSNVCPQCNGSGVHVPEELHCLLCRGSSVLKCHSPLELGLSPSTADGSTVHMPGKGDSGVYGGTPGNLFVTVKVDPTPGMEFHKDRVTVWVNASPAQFVVGDAFPVAIRGEDITVQMPPLTGRAEVTVLGVKVLVRANVVMPLKIDQAQRELYSRLLFLETGRDAGQRVSRRKLEAIPAWVAPAEDDVPAPVKEKTSLDTPLVGRKTPRHVPRKKKAAGTRKRVTPGRTHR